MIIGLNGCRCHPYESWEELDRYNKQKIIIGAKYKTRCSGAIGIATGLCEDNDRFVNIFMEPYDCARCNSIEHKQNLILLE